MTHVYIQYPTFSQLNTLRALGFNTDLQDIGIDGKPYYAMYGPMMSKNLAYRVTHMDNNLLLLLTLGKYDSEIGELIYYAHMDD